MFVRHSKHRSEISQELGDKDFHNLNNNLQKKQSIKIVWYVYVSQTIFAKKIR